MHATLRNSCKVGVYLKSIWPVGLEIVALEGPTGGAIGRHALKLALHMSSSRKTSICGVVGWYSSKEAVRGFVPPKRTDTVTCTCSNGKDREVPSETCTGQRVIYALQRSSLPNAFYGLHTRRFCKICASKHESTAEGPPTQTMTLMNYSGGWRGIQRKFKQQAIVHS